MDGGGDAYPDPDAPRRVAACDGAHRPCPSLPMTGPTAPNMGGLGLPLRLGARVGATAWVAVAFTWRGAGAAAQTHGPEAEAGLFASFEGARAFALRALLDAPWVAYRPGDRRGPPRGTERTTLGAALDAVGAWAPLPGAAGPGGEGVGSHGWEAEARGLGRTRGLRGARAWALRVRVLLIEAAVSE